MGTYPPRECGIATFNQDLLNSSQKFLGDSILCHVLAMNLSAFDTYKYPNVVKYQLNQEDCNEHKLLAHAFNENPTINGIIIQHEYGIYGGHDGENILCFIEACNKPIVVTLHTVLPNPSEHMKDVTSKIIAASQAVVVLTESSKVILEQVYPHSIDKVHVIPHGVHQTEFTTTIEAKKKLHLENTTVLTTFGLLSRGKGIEYVIESLPEIVKTYPTVRYHILGETHPVVRREEGENYRKELASLVRKLCLEKHVIFYDHYLSLKDLIEFLKATDIYISTSINPNQAVSGTLSYALGTGRTVISTDFTQAREILSKETGRLVPIKSAESYTKALLELLGSPNQLTEMHKKAYDMTRPMLWTNVANQYSKILKQNIMPPIKLTHLKNMTDSFGLFQFATIDSPSKESGYTLDDNARAMIVASWTQSYTKIKMDGYIRTYLKCIEACQQNDGSFINYIDHFHKQATTQNATEDLEDATARALWGLSEVMINKEVENELRLIAKRIFYKSLSAREKLSHNRARATIIKAFSNIIKNYPENESDLSSYIRTNADALIHEYDRNSFKSWKWFEPQLGYNNGILPESLILAGTSINNSSYTKKGLDALSFLISKTFSNNQYMPIGQSHWYKNNEKRSHFDQQPEDPASMILALVTAFEITHDEYFKQLAKVCFSWFLGNNSLQESLYNYENGGCFDGLHPDRVNQNQGAESLVSYLLARLSIEKLKVL